MSRFRKKLAKCAAALTMLASFWAQPAAALERLPNDTYFSEQWYLRQIGAPEAWNRSLGLETVAIAIIDSGVDIDHPDLKDNIWVNRREVPGDRIDNDGNGYVDDVNGWDFVDNDNNPRPALDGDYDVLGASHGTISAGIAAGRGNNGIGIAGVSWQSAIMPLRVLDSKGEGERSFRIAQAVEYAVKNGARVINLSFAGPTNSDLLAIALKRAYEAGVFIVAAAGNAAENGVPYDLDRNPLYPICLDKNASENFIFGVTSTDEADRKARFANYGGCVDITAPGTRVVATQAYSPARSDFKNAYGGYYSGTSVSAPMVSGLAALLIALDKNLKPAQIAKLIQDNSVSIDPRNPETPGKLGRGRIDAAAAVAAVGRAAAPTPTAALATADLLPPGTRRLFVTGPGPGRAADIRFFTEDGIFVREFQAFPATFKGGVSLALGNFNGAARTSVVVGALAGGAPQVRVFNVNGTPIGGFFAFDAGFRGGVQVAAGDLDGDGKDEIIAAAGPGGGPHVRMFKADGTPIGGFFAFDAGFRGGVQVAAGDLDGDGKDEIIAAAGPRSGRGAGPTAVRIFNAKGTMLNSFLPFGNRYFAGASVAAADTNEDGKDEVIVGALAALARPLAIFTDKGILVREMRDGALFRGYRVAGAVGGPRRLFYSGTAGSTPLVSPFNGQSGAPFLAYEPKFRGGLSLGIIEWGR